MAADKISFRGFPRGVDNLHANFDLGSGVLRNGVNVDVLTSGRVRRRRGIAVAMADAGAHSVFSDGQRMVWATANTLRVSTDGLTKATVLTDARLVKPLSYVPLNGEIYFSNEYVNGKINALNQHEPWGITPPSLAPVVPDGSGLQRIQVTCTFVTALGEESGAPLAAAMACDNTAWVWVPVTEIPQSSDSRVVATRLYATAIGGTEFFAMADVPAGVTSFQMAVSTGSNNGNRLMTQLMTVPPPGHLITEHGGCIYVASSNLMFRTQPLRFGCYDPEQDFHMEPERITLLAGVDDGIYLSSDQHYFLSALSGDNPARTPLLPYRAIEGGVYRLPDSKDVIWLSERGLIRGSKGGAARNLTEARIAMTRYSRATVGVIEREGHRAAIAITQGGAANPLVSDDFTTAEAARLADLE